MAALVRDARQHAADKEYVAMIKRTAARFGGKVVGDKVYDLPPGARNTNSGYQQVQASDSPWRPKARPITTWSGSPTPMKASATI